VLIVVRHGQTTANASGLLLGRADVPLTDIGLEQADALAAAVGSVDLVVSSPLQRARQTADAFGVPVDVDDRWTELDYGVYDEKPITEVPAELWNKWRTDPNYTPPEGESLASVGERVRAACDELSARAVDDDVVVVSHVSPIKAAVAWALATDDLIAWRTFVGLASITRIGITDRGPLLRTFNEMAHLGQSS
jgi:broad specificity phosphatase PhoE